VTSRLPGALCRALRRFCLCMVSTRRPRAGDMARHPSSKAKRPKRIRMSDEEVSARFWEILIAERLRAIDEERS
jgi:hypothetical protein